MNIKKYQTGKSPYDLNVMIVLPTLNRPNRLMRFLNSAREHALSVPVYVSHETDARPLTEIINGLVHYAFEEGADIIIPLADDVELLPGSIKAIVDTFTDSGGLDLMVGMNQTNIPDVRNCTEFAFFGVGRSFCLRYPNQQIFCPDYHHFYGDTELGLGARYFERFKFCSDARLIHHHPAYSKDAIDDTHNKSRQHQKNDVAKWEARQAAGLLWGPSLSLLLDS